ncbi:hypothetical protein phiAS5_ORF0115 [Aeromonas phage phiAS5]|uniref:Tail fiber protein n=1 Tax=Aeromonas phage phiAS5 TaxID=879630 RepID=E1A2L2_9CAUD|nr:tail fiber protein [Aeromonas phage phiAS5]ADM79958.1 hypothetical protein phiAS5_ORF0115 [Aeromonas phage phiAS5]
MADLKLGSQIGGNLIWHQGILELNPLDDSLFYKEFDVITSKGGQTINGGINLKGDIVTTGKVIAVGNDVGWGQAPNAAFNMDKDNTAGAHWLIASRKADGTPRSGIQVLTNDVGEVRIYTNKNANYVGFRDGQVFIPATTPSAASHAARKDYVDREVDKAMQFAETTTDKLTADLATANTKIDTLDAQNVKITGAQSIAGTKTFTDPVVLEDQPTADTHAANKKYVDTKVGTAVQGIATTAPLTTTGGVNPTLAITAASRTASGSMSAQDKVKLDDLPADALSRSGGNMKNGGYINIEGVGGLRSLYNSKTYSIMRDHNNGNVTLGAASGDLYLGYNTTAEEYTTKNVVLHQAMKWNAGNGRVLVDTDGFIPWASIKDKVGLEGKTKNIRGPINFDEYESTGFYNLYLARATGSVNPPPLDYGTMFVIGSDKDANTFVTQIATDRTQGSTYIRTRNDGTMAWTPWVKQIDERGGDVDKLKVNQDLVVGNGIEVAATSVVHTVKALGNTADAKPSLILLAKRSSSTPIEKNGFIGKIIFNRGATTSNLQSDYAEVAVYSGYTEQYARIHYLSGAKTSGTKLVYHTYNGVEYIALYRSAISMAHVVVDGLRYGAHPILIPDATGLTVTDISVREEILSLHNLPTNDDLNLVSRAGDAMTGTLTAAKIKNSIMVNDKGSISFQDAADTRFHLASESNSLTLSHGNEGQNALVSFLGDGSINATGPVVATAFRSSGDYGFVRSTNSTQGMFVGADGRTIIGGGAGATGTIHLRPQGIGTTTVETIIANDGTITLGKQGTAAGHLVNKAYVDAVDAKNVAKAGDSMTGALNNTKAFVSNDYIMVDKNSKKLALEIDSGTSKIPYISVDATYRALEFLPNRRVLATHGYEVGGTNSTSEYFFTPLSGVSTDWARGFTAIETDGSRKAAFGFHGKPTGEIDFIYLGVGAAPWNANAGIQINANNQMLMKDGQSGAATFGAGASALFINNTSNAWFHINRQTGKGFEGLAISDGVAPSETNPIAVFEASKILLRRPTYVYGNGQFQINTGGNPVLEFHVPGKHARIVWLDNTTGDLNFGQSNGSFGEAKRYMQMRAEGTGLTMYGTNWAAGGSHAYADQWAREAPIQIDFGAVAGSSDYYQIVKGRSVVSGVGYTTDVELGVLRSGNVWGQGIIRVGSGESGTKGTMGIYTFDISGNFRSPGGVYGGTGVYDSGDRVYSVNNPPPSNTHTHNNIRATSAVTIFDGDVGGGNFALTRPWTDFDMIMFVVGWDDMGLVSPKTFTRYDLEYLQAIGWNYDISGGSGGLGWGGRFSADNRTFVTAWENGRVRKVVGYNLRTVN